MNTATVTRVCVVNHSNQGQFGRVIDVRDVGVELQLQDDGKTLKVFIFEDYERKQQ